MTYTKQPTSLFPDVNKFTERCFIKRSIVVQKLNVFVTVGQPIEPHYELHTRVKLQILPDNIKTKLEVFLNWRCNKDRFYNTSFSSNLLVGRVNWSVTIRCDGKACQGQPLQHSGPIHCEYGHRFFNLEYETYIKHILWYTVNSHGSCARVYQTFCLKLRLWKHGRIS